MEVPLQTSDQQMHQTGRKKTGVLQSRELILCGGRSQVSSGAVIAREWRA